MAKPAQAIGKAKKQAARDRILTRGQNKLAAKHARAQARANKQKEQKA